MTDVVRIPFGAAVKCKLMKGGPRMLAMGYCKHSGEVICEWLNSRGEPNVWGFPAGHLTILAVPTKELPWRAR